MKAEKCKFHTPSVSFLGFIIVRPRPESCKQLHRFLGFANFCRCFIRNHSTVAVQLTLLTSTKGGLPGHQRVDTAFQELNRWFATASILKLPDPSRQFVVKVDASNTGVGTVLSQRAREDQKLHPCTFFSCRCQPAERNYDVGNLELLAVKLALAELTGGCWAAIHRVDRPPQLGVHPNGQEAELLAGLVVAVFYTLQHFLFLLPSADALSRQGRRTRVLGGPRRTF